MPLPEGYAPPPIFCVWCPEIFWIKSAPSTDLFVWANEGAARRAYRDHLAEQHPEKLDISRPAPVDRWQHLAAGQKTKEDEAKPTQVVTIIENGKPFWCEQCGSTQFTTEDFEHYVCVGDGSKYHFPKEAVAP